MASQLTIALRQIRFFGHHGLHKEERKTGNEFEIELLVYYHTGKAIIASISETVNYVGLYNLLKTEMQVPRDLLETFLMETAEKIHNSYPQVEKVDISILKLHAPIAGLQGTVGVHYSKDFTQH